MTITEDMRAVDAEYGEECLRARQDPLASALMRECLRREYDEIDEVLPDFVSDIALSSGVPDGTLIAPWIYQLARMSFRLGMRAQRKLDRPAEPSSMFWRTDERPV